MASSYMLGNRTVIYIVKVSSTGRGRKTIVDRAFIDYDEAMCFMDQMEEKYRDQYIVEFDTKFK